MSKVLVSTSYLSATANSIRSILNTNDTYLPSEFSTAILTSTALLPVKPLYYDYNSGYVAAGTWTYENPTNTYVDIYQVYANHTYYISEGNEVGTRFRVMFTPEDVTQTTSKITGVNIVNTNNPSKLASTSYTPEQDGFLIVAKDNIGESNLKTYVWDRSNLT